jgi:hypothetical protein
MRFITFSSLLIFSAFMLSGNQVYSQRKFRNAAFVELGGNAIAYSLNYERHFSNKMNVRIGVSYIFRIYSVPLTIGKIYGTKAHHFEIAGGVDAVSVYELNNDVPSRKGVLFLTGFIGYRYQKPSARFFMRVGFTPMWFVYSADRVDQVGGFAPWAGIGAGFRF